MGLILETVPFKIVKNCLKLSNGTVELIISTDFGPRVLFYGFTGGANVFRTFDDQLAKPGGNEWKAYGGHRLWHAPEVVPRTYYPDNEKISYTWNGTILTLNCPPEISNGLGKRITIELSGDGTNVRVNHTLINKNVWGIDLSVWCLSVMAEGGRLVVPQEKYEPHPDCLVPARPLVLWHFTKMNDPRFVWGERYIQMRQDNSIGTKQKFGLCNTKGWAAYCLEDLVFLKRYPYFPGAEYPDMGCNSEFYTEPGFLEIESLSPVERIESGKEINHEEQWSLHAMTAGENETDLDRISALAE
jgi:hypothetical protein